MHGRPCHQAGPSSYKQIAVRRMPNFEETSMFYGNLSGDNGKTFLEALSSMLPTFCEARSEYLKHVQ